MKKIIENDVPIFLQVAKMIEDDILAEVYHEDEPIVSTTEISKFLNINPATAVKGVSLLDDEGIVYKKRGIGMFVSVGAKEIIRKKRVSELFKKKVRNLVVECKKLEIDEVELIKIIKENFYDND